MYLVAVKIEGLMRRRKSTGLVHAIIGFFLLLKCFDLYNYLVIKSALPTLPFLAVAGLSLFYAFFRQQTDPRAKHNAAIRLLQCITFLCFGVLMVRLGKQIDYISLFIWALLCFILFFSEKKLYQETNITISEAGIIIPGTYRHHIVDWSTLENVVVRYDFITLFHKGKKFLQYQVMQDLSELELVKMNSFCQEQLEKFKDNRE